MDVFPQDDRPFDLLTYLKGGEKDGQHSASLGDVMEITQKGTSQIYNFLRGRV